VRHLDPAPRNRVKKEKEKKRWENGKNWGQTTQYAAPADVNRHCDWLVFFFLNQKQKKFGYWYISER
jgi:hypothetical protein